MTYGPQVPGSDAQHAVKYRGTGESFEESCNRQASGLAHGDHYKPFRDVLLNQRFLSGGRIQSSVGSFRNITPFNCYLSGTILDSLREGDGSIMARFDQAMGTLQMGGGIGYDFSPLRPRGSEIKKLGTTSGGPMPFMNIFDAGCKCISAAGHRRGAQMGVLRVDHPDIEEFIHAKQNTTEFTAFNLSIAVTDEFMLAVVEDKPFWLRFEGKNFREVNARDLWEMIMRSTWDWGEPGVIFIDQINDRNNLHYCETIAATNPCGEQPLPPFGACLLGSFNLTKYLKRSISIPGSECLGEEGPLEWNFDYAQLEADIPHVVRAMDNVIDIATYPLPEQEREAKSKRRMGLGVTGVANAIERLALPYGSPDFCIVLRSIMETIRDGCYRASVDLAKEKGAFPLFDAEEYCRSPFIKTLPLDLQEDIRKYGIRNSHLLSVAPTGTISLCADNISSGIEPVFAYNTDRAIIGSDQVTKIHSFEDYGVRFLGHEGKIASEVTIEEHLAVLSTAQSMVDSAVSKTCNVDGTMPWDDFKNIYMKAWRMGCKGITTYNSDGKRGSVLVDADKKSCRIDPVTGRQECD